VTENPKLKAFPSQSVLNPTLLEPNRQTGKLVKNEIVDQLTND